MIPKKKKVKDYGIYVPKRIARMVRKGILTWDEAGVYALIDALENLQLGCIAHVSHFVKRLNSSDKAIRVRIKKLIDMGLVEVLSFDGRHRKLRTVASTAIKNTENSSPAKSASQAGRTDRSYNRLITNGNSPNGELHRRNKISPVGDSFGLSDKNKISTFDQMSLKLSKLLRQGVTKLDGMAPSWQSKTQAKHISTLRKKVKNDHEVYLVISWYCDQLNEGRGHLKAEYIPFAFIPQKFHEKYSAIKDKMEEMTGEEVAPRRSRNPINADTGEEFTDEEMEN